MSGVRFYKVAVGWYATNDGRWAVVSDNGQWAAVGDGAGRLRRNHLVGEDLDRFDTKREAIAYLHSITDEKGRVR